MTHPSHRSLQCLQLKIRISKKSEWSILGPVPHPKTLFLSSFPIYFLWSMEGWSFPDIHIYNFLTSISIISDARACLLKNANSSDIIFSLSSERRKMYQMISLKCHFLTKNFRYFTQLWFFLPPLHFA